jgi:hypothetical protein
MGMIFLKFFSFVLARAKILRHQDNNPVHRPLMNEVLEILNTITQAEIKEYDNLYSVYDSQLLKEYEKVELEKKASDSNKKEEMIEDKPRNKIKKENSIRKLSTPEQTPQPSPTLIPQTSSLPSSPVNSSPSITQNSSPIVPTRPSTSLPSNPLVKRKTDSMKGSDSKTGSIESSPKSDDKKKGKSGIMISFLFLLFNQN